jgi:hypothetical protein
MVRFRAWRVWDEWPVPTTHPADQKGHLTPITGDFFIGLAGRFIAALACPIFGFLGFAFVLFGVEDLARPS